MNIDPLDKRLPGLRYLNDRGIRQAIDFGFINPAPNIDFSKEGKRLQPGTLDLKLKHVNDSMTLSSIHPSTVERFSKDTTLQARSYNELLLTESFTHDTKVPELHVDFIFPSIEARSSVRRLGGYIPHHGGMFMRQQTGTLIEMSNYSRNDIIFDPGECIVQAFFRVDPFKDELLKAGHVDIMDIITVDWNISTPNLKETFEKARSLDMGIEITTDDQLKWLLKEGYLEISPEATIRDGQIIVHASEHASAINKIDGGIVFSKRKEYQDKLHRHFSIKKGHTIQPYEHIDIETVESFKLSPYIGIQFYNNPQQRFMDELRAGLDLRTAGENLDLTRMIDGWVDPGYEGPFSRQPKWFTPTLIRPGDPIGFGKAIFYPNGVQRSYGDASLGSQYHKASATAIAKEERGDDRRL